MDKKQQIKETLLKTKEKRKTQTCKVFELKLAASHLSKEKQEYLRRLFKEAKWFYNYLLAADDVFSVDTKINKVVVLNKDKEPEERKLIYLSSQMKQAIKDKLIASIKSLSTKKKRGGKIGKLKFKSFINAITLKQFNVTYKLDIENNRISIQGFKKKFRVRGFKQIPKSVDFANATLICKPSGYYLKLTCYLPLEVKITTGKCIGLDFGIKTSITDSEGNKYNFRFPETKRIKQLSGKVNRGKKGSNTRRKNIGQLRKHYERLDNQKKDLRNKFVAGLVKTYDLIAVQDENIKGWHKNRSFSRRVQHSIMGGIISELKKHSETFVVDRFYASTKTCYVCEVKNEIGLKQRVYRCSCGYVCDRDIHAARNILKEALKTGAEHNRGEGKVSLIYSMISEAQGL